MKNDEIEKAGMEAEDQKQIENERLIEAANAQAEASAARLAEQGQPVAQAENGLNANA